MLISYTTAAVYWSDSIGICSTTFKDNLDLTVL